MKPLFIVGCGNMALTLFAYFKEFYQVVGFAVDDNYRTTDTFLDLPVHSLEAIEKNTIPEQSHFVVAIGFQDMNEVRQRKFNELKHKGYLPAKLILNPQITQHNVSIGAGSAILDNTSIHAGTVVGENTFISTGVNIGHGCRIGNNVWINSGVTIAGDVVIGDNTVIGVGANIGNNIEIAEYNFIGAGSLVVKTTEKYDTFAVRQTEKLAIMSKQFLQLSNIYRSR
ncbi:acetyltransferase [Pseudoalteromonas sp. NC201]|uniref:acetyltransferase n=1 Tax=Pseudoalteromonas sp. NC201 TaxID=1514074 RepID=UPI000C7A5CEC|nr:acetyltransferase [Pseudoalteromonas sp. NC201]AUJ69478.1 Serine acetyltransferase [Pseudoalteromonas sp. NC201]